MIENSRMLQAQETMKKFNKKHKTAIFSFGNEIVDAGVIPTSVKDVDDFLGGGFKRSAHTLLWGMYSVGKTALILTTIANAQKLGLVCCYVNTEKPIDRERFEFFGVNLSEMIYIEAPENAEQALEGMRTLCNDKVIDLFIIDSTNGLCPKSVQVTKEGAERGLEKKNVASLPLALSDFYNRVNAQVYRSKAAVVWIGQARTQGIGGFFAFLGLSGGNAQNFYAYMIVKMQLGDDKNSPKNSYKNYFCDPEGKVRFETIKESCGFPVVFRMDKTNSCKSVKKGKKMEVPFYDESGFFPSPEKELSFKIEGTDKEKKIINDYLIKKGIIDNVEPLIPDTTVITEQVDKEVADVVNLNCGVEDSKNESLIVDNQDIKVKKPTKKRGRPKVKKEK